MPTDGVVKAQADEITRGASTDIQKARAIYDWIVDNTFRNPKTRGCGVGDIRFMLESKDLGGKCADLNALYVGLARAAGLPARHVYGLRIAGSDLGYKSLGTSSSRRDEGDSTAARRFISTATAGSRSDPADVRKVVLEEPPGNRPIDDEMVKKARARLFGSWEMNWMAYNYGHDVVLPGSEGAPCIYFMYPQAETAEGRLDPFDAGQLQVRDHVPRDHVRWRLTVGTLPDCGRLPLGYRKCVLDRSGFGNREEPMKRVDLSKPEFFFIVATRAILGMGLGLLGADRIARKQRRYVAAALIAVGALTTVPAAFAVFRGGKKTLKEVA